MEPVGAASTSKRLKTTLVRGGPTALKPTGGPPTPALGQRRSRNARIWRPRVIEMGEGEQAAAAAAAAGEIISQATRIYVGGLSVSVTAGDIGKAFSSLGKVAGIDLVRNKGRSFGYMDFEPNSEKALAKLFSTYNGCTWKGGKLKLEKAKEHYLARLKQEWAEDSKGSPTTPKSRIAEKDAGHLKNLKLLNQEKENMQLKLYFPKLRKVKSLPFKGTGKHKYSFQRIQVPSRPIHFCDCEEHYNPLEIQTELIHKHPSSPDKVVHEKELKIMRSVMEKLLGEQDDGTATEKITKLPADSKALIHDDLKLDDEEAAAAQDSDVDNLVTNFGAVRSDIDILMNYKGAGALLLNQESRYGESKPKMDYGLNQDKPNSRSSRKAAVTPGTTDAASKKRGHTILEDVIVEEKSQQHILPSSISSQVHQEPEKSAEAPTEKPGKGNSWLQKSSWKNLVGERGSGSFSISNVVLPGIEATSLINQSKDTFALPSDTSNLKKRGIASDVVQVIPQKSGYGELQLTKDDGSNQDKPDTRRSRKAAVPPGKTDTASKKRGRTILEDVIVEDKPQPHILPSSISSQAHQEPEKSAEAPTVEPGKGSSWLQKSSWKDLVGEGGIGSFSISNVAVPGINTTTLTDQPKDAFALPSGTSNSEKRGITSDVVQVIPQVKASIEPRGVDESERDDSGPKLEEGDERGAALQNHGDEEPKRKRIGMVGVGEEVCTFMKNSESEKEWAKAKAALSGFVKKKSIITGKTDSSKWSKGMHSRKL